MYKCLKRECKEDGTRFFIVVARDKTRGSGHRLKRRNLPLNIKIHFFTVRMTEHWHRLSREVVECPSLELLKSHLGMVLDNWL